MKTLRAQKRMAAQVLDVGENRVWFDPERIQDIKEAVTKIDIKELIKDKAIKKRAIVGVKKRAHKKRLKRKKKGRRRGKGKRRKIIKKRKRMYVQRIRKLRDYLKKRRTSLSGEKYKQIKKLILGGQILQVQDMKSRIEK